MQIIIRLNSKNGKTELATRMKVVVMTSQLLRTFRFLGDDDGVIVFEGEENKEREQEIRKALEKTLEMCGCAGSEISFENDKDEEFGHILDSLEAICAEDKESEETEEIKKGEDISDTEASGYLDVERESILKSLTKDVKRNISDECAEEKPSFDKNLRTLEDYRVIKPSFGSLQKDIADLKKALLKEVKGQQHAVDAFVRAYFGAEVLIEKEHKGPLATFLFAGPPGCGKTYLAECASRCLKGRPFARFDMSEYGDLGASVNGQEFGGRSGVITRFVKENPSCIVLFDEIEKASLNNLKLFLQILDAGAIRDAGTHEEVSFKDAILIFTTNVAKNLYEEAEGSNLSGVSKSTIISAVESDKNPATNKPYFPKELVSRWAKGTVVLFNRLEPYAIKEIVLKELKYKVEVAEKNTGIEIICDYDKVASLIMYSVGGSGDARTMVGAVTRFMESELFDAISQLTRRNMDVDRLKRIFIGVDCSASKVRGMFEEKSKVPVLFATDARYSSDLKNVCSVNGIKATVRSDLKSVKSALDGSVDAVVLDVFLKEKQSDRRPSDFEDINSAGVAVFEYILANYPEIPVYLLNDEAKGFDDVSYDTFLSRGAKGVVRFRKGDTKFNSASLAFVKHATLTGNNFYRMARGCNVLGYNCAQSIEDDGTTLRITARRLEIKRAVMADDINSVVADMSRPRIKFSDVIGAKEVKEAMRDCVNYLTNPKKYTASGRKAPKGILLYGPPGTGKTMLAKALAGETDVAFIEKNGTEFFRMYVGQGPESMRRMFRTARRYAPSIVFIDEVNAFGRLRTGSDSTASAEQLLNTFLSEMDGFKNNENKPVIVVCATNYAIKAEGAGDDAVLDPAFVRRFDKKILVDLPELDERRELLRHFLKLNGVNPDTVKKGAEMLAKKTAGYCHDLLRKLVDDVVKRADGRPVTDKMLEDAYDRAEYGDEKEYSEESVLRTARHETGHAIVSWATGETPSYITVVARGDYGGYMMNDEDDSECVSTKEQILNSVCCALGGRAAELIYYGEDGGLTTGPSSDLIKATKLAARLVGNWGMQKGRLAVAGLFGDAVAKDVYEQVNAILEEQLERAKKLISLHRTAADKLVNALREYNSLDSDAVTELIGDPPANKK